MSETSLIKNRTIAAHIFGIVSLIAFAYLSINVAFHYKQLPKEIPNHFNLLGEIDGTGGKSVLIVLTVIAWSFFACFTVAELIPNDNKTLTAEQFKKQLNILAESISFMKAVLMVDFAYICNRTITFNSLGKWFMPVFLLLIFITIIVMSIKLVRVNKKR